MQFAKFACSSGRFTFDAACKVGHVDVHMYFVGRREVTQSTMAKKAMRVLDLRNTIHVDLWVGLFREWEDDSTDSEHRDIFDEVLEIGLRGFTGQTDACVDNISDGPMQRSQLVQVTAHALRLKTMVARINEPEKGACFGVYLGIERQWRDPKTLCGASQGGESSTHRNALKNK
jgi:hypothetical protein